MRRRGDGDANAKPQPARGELSAPGHAHVPRDGRALVVAVDDEVVPLRLAADGLVDRGMQDGVALGRAQRRPQVGRVVLPEKFAEYARITESAAFVGLGKSFQIWEPNLFAEHEADLRDRARSQGTRLPPLGIYADRRRE